MNLNRLLFGTLFDETACDPLNEVLFAFPDSTPYTVRDLLQSVAIMGASGSGKTSGSGLLIARAMVNLKNSGGLILVSKPEDKQFWIDRFVEAGRDRDLIIFGRHERARCNFIDFELQHGGDARSLMEFVIVTGEALEKGGTGENGKFWEKNKKTLLYNAIEPCRLAWGRLTIPMIHQFITSALYNTAVQLSTVKPEGGGDSPREQWEKGVHFQTMDRAMKKEKTAIERHDYGLYHDYWSQQFPSMEQKVRSSILADVMSVLHTYNTGLVREMVSTQTNTSPELMEQRQVYTGRFSARRRGRFGPPHHARPETADTKTYPAAAC